MLIEVKTNGTMTRFININHIVMIENGHQGGVLIYLNGMESIFSSEDIHSLQLRINEAFDKSKK